MKRLEKNKKTENLIKTAIEEADYYTIQQALTIDKFKKYYNTISDLDKVKTTKTRELCIIEVNSVPMPFWQNTMYTDDQKDIQFFLVDSNSKYFLSLDDFLALKTINAKTLKSLKFKLFKIITDI